MAVAPHGTASNYLQRAPSTSGLADVVELILDKGLVIDAYVRVAVIGIELVTIDARIVVASVDTYLRFAEAVNRLDLNETELGGLPELQEKGAEKMTEGAIEGVENELLPDSSTLRTAAKAVAAAAYARSTSSAVETGAVANTSPVDGSTRSERAPPAESTCSPPTRLRRLSCSATGPPRSGSAPSIPLGVLRPVNGNG